MLSVARQTEKKLILLQEEESEALLAMLSVARQTEKKLILLQEEESEALLAMLSVELLQKTIEREEITDMQNKSQHATLYCLTVKSFLLD